MKHGKDIKMIDYNDGFEFIDDCGTFRFRNPSNVNELYFPLCNDAGFMSSVTPMLNGDSKADQHHFLLPPVTIEDFYNSRSARNFWFYIHDRGAWSATGNSAEQISKRYSEMDHTERMIEAGFLWHKLLYRDKSQGLTAEILSFIPIEDKVEMMYVTLMNEGEDEIRVTPTSAVPLYGRSAENIRDHRHVTSLVNRLTMQEYGMLMKPEIVFDERGHRYNHTSYYILGAEEDGSMPVGAIPSAHSFAGKSGCYDWPEAVVKNLEPALFNGECLDGKEYIGALRFKEALLKPGERIGYIIMLGICHDPKEMDAIYHQYNTADKLVKALEKNQKYWSKRADNTTFTSGLDGFSNWMSWVALQPVFRKIYGCSFLPHHDYGKGGRGWRDLWQDCQSLILQNPEVVREMLFNNFGGVRVDGTNATIIGSKPGEFIADRNNIPRVWMDHGSWPYLTTKLYVDYSGDLSFLLEKQVYFRDALIQRASGRDERWSQDQGQNLQMEDGKLYTGTILEHILVQHLTSFFNVGEHNIIRLEGGDWNDTLDMARERGESIAFSALYAGNLISLSKLLTVLENKLEIKRVELLEELCMLLDTLTGEADYDDAAYKKALLDAYLKAVIRRVSGRKASLKIGDISRDLRKKGEWLFQHINQKEWVETKDGDGFFNGYYNNDGQRVDGQIADGVRMNLTAQVFTTMVGLASDEQVMKSYHSCRKYLKDPRTGGYRLNTDLGGNRLNFGRGFAFAYGEKENGSVFSHMVVMYINALYKRGFAKEAYEVFKSLYLLSTDTQKNGIYPGIPEYFTPEGKGMYHYLTGSASWMMLTVLNEMYGIRGENGDLVIQPRLMAEQFSQEGTASVLAWFQGCNIKVEYKNSSLSDYPDYHMASVTFDGKILCDLIEEDGFVKIPGTVFMDLSSAEPVKLEITLEKSR